MPAKLIFFGTPEGPEKEAPLCGEVIETVGMVVSDVNAILMVILYQFWLPALSVALAVIV